MHEKYEQLKAILAQVWDLNSASGLLGWDQQTYMPPRGAGTYEAWLPSRPLRTRWELLMKSVNW